MKLTVEQIQEKSHDEICAVLTELAPQVLEAHDHYYALIAQQRAYVAARALSEAGLKLGQKVQMRGQSFGYQNPMALVAEPANGYLMFQVLKKDGQPRGEPQPSFMFSGFDHL